MRQRRFPKSLLIAVLVSCSCFAVSAFAVPSAKDLAGKWTGTMETPRGASELSLIFSQQNSKLTGEATSERGTLALDDVAISADGKLTFSMTMTMREQKRTMTYSGTLKGNTLTGQWTMGGQRTIPFTATRAGKSSGGAKGGGINGTWNMVAVYQGSEYPNSFEFATEGGKLTGYYIGGAGKTAVQNPSLTGGELKFSFTHPQGGEINMSLNVDGGSLKGTASGYFGEAKVTGQKE
jgi:hypothetical protein